MKVLVVDDAMTNRKVLAALLARAGHCVVTANDGAEALSRFRAEPFDAVLTDLHLGDGVGGRALAQNLRQAANGTPVRIALMTADGDGVAAEDLFDAVLEKPVHFQKLQDFLNGGVA